MSIRRRARSDAWWTVRHVEPPGFDEQADSGIEITRAHIPNFECAPDRGGEFGRYRGRFAQFESRVDPTEFAVSPCVPLPPDALEVSCDRAGCLLGATRLRSVNFDGDQRAECGESLPVGCFIAAATS